MKQFVVGKDYYCRSACDYNCVWVFAVKSRTDHTVTLKQPGKEPITKRIYTHEGVETVRPLGSYSMAPILGADKTN